MNDHCHQARPSESVHASVLRARRAWVLLSWTVFVWALLGGEARAQFRPPSRISSATLTVGSYDLGLDYFENLTVAYEENGELNLEARIGQLIDKTVLGPGSDPSLAFGPLAVHVAYSTKTDGTISDRQVVVASRVGGQWNSPEELSDPGSEDRLPTLQLVENRVHVAAWQSKKTQAQPEIWFRRGNTAPVNIGRGEKPSLVIDKVGRAHIFFLRDGDIFYAKEESSQHPGVFLPSENITRTPAAAESRPSAAVWEGQTIYVCYSRQGDVLLANNSAGDFSNPMSFEESAAANPNLFISPNGVLAVAYERDGDIFLSMGTTFFIPASVPVVETPEVESEARVVVDSSTNAFVAFRREGILYYSTNAGPPRAKFTAEPTKGEAPLSVEFTDKSTGTVTGWSWDFGDGATSTERNPVHRFESSGEYVVRLSVSGPGGKSPLVDAHPIFVLDPRNEIHVADVKVFPGQKGVYLPVIATHDQPTQGYTVAATFDPSVIEVRKAEFYGTNVSGLVPELFAVSISKDPDDPFVTAGMLFDVTDPFDGRVMPPGTDLRILNIIVDVRADAVPGSRTQMLLKNHVGRPPLNNIFTVNGFSVLPTIGEGGTISIAHLEFPPPRFFIRGDTDGNGEVNVTDTISTLAHLFLGGQPPDCADAADVSDDGVLDISDALYALGFLFRATSYPPPPFPAPGLDPTDDDLAPCLLR